MIHQMMEHSVRCPADTVKNKNNHLKNKWLFYFSSESWTRTSDLRVMSPTSYRLLYLAVFDIANIRHISGMCKF